MGRALQDPPRLLPRQTPAAGVDPDRVRRALAAAHRRAALLGGGQFDAQRAADLAGVAVADMTVILRVLVARGLVAAERAGKRHVYTAAAFDGYEPSSANRPAAGLRGRELWTVLSLILGSGRHAPTETIAAGLAVPAGPVDPVWLEIRLAGLVAGRLLHLSGQMWTLASAGVEHARRLRGEPVDELDVWAVIAGQNPRAGDAVDTTVIAQRLGVAVEDLTTWLRLAITGGDVQLVGRNQIMPTAGGRRLVSMVDCPGGES
ncbi:hypothetical protein [Frankia sp. QA3]|uniref:hypothetical protein n=1 Tax=Frankia sp. QA3 TaxID=710111 RepID=UPI000269BCD3|nr:hypothetical protein [Frankia sp. QA3]EIV92256.1 hypothetical protein FraQA3DRAFT_1789 [Frankia sp. QA3]